MITVISYATPSFSESQEVQRKSVEHYWTNEINYIGFSPKQLDRRFAKANAEILSYRKGAGYWLWKPYIIYKTMGEIDSNDILVYLDAGVSVCDSYDVSQLVTEEDPICLFMTHGHPNANWTKKEFLEVLNCETESFLNAAQCAAGMQIYLKTEKSMRFVETYLKLCCDKRLLLDDSKTGHPYVERKEFKGHRHDQTVLSYLAWKNDIVSHRDPSQYGNEYMAEFSNDTYPQIFNQHRSRKTSMWEQTVIRLQYLKRALFKN